MFQIFLTIRKKSILKSIAKTKGNITMILRLTDRLELNTYHGRPGSINLYALIKEYLSNSIST